MKKTEYKYGPGKSFLRFTKEFKDVIALQTIAKEVWGQRIEPDRNFPKLISSMDYYMKRIKKYPLTEDKRSRIITECNKVLYLVTLFSYFISN